MHQFSTFYAPNYFPFIYNFSSPYIINTYFSSPNLEDMLYTKFG